MNGILGKILLLLLLTSRTITININGVFDKIVIKVAEMIEDYEPLDLGDAELINLSNYSFEAKLDLRNGKLYNLTTMKRDGRARLSLNMSTSGIDIRGPIIFKNLQVFYDYYGVFYGKQPGGVFHANTKGVHGHFLLAVLPVNKLKLVEASLDDVDKVTIELTGFGDYNFLMTTFATTFTEYFKYTILKKLSELIHDLGKEAVESFTPTEVISWGLKSKESD